MTPAQNLLHNLPKGQVTDSSQVGSLENYLNSLNNAVRYLLMKDIKQNK